MPVHFSDVHHGLTQHPQHDTTQQKIYLNLRKEIVSVTAVLSVYQHKKRSSLHKQTNKQQKIKVGL